MLATLVEENKTMGWIFLISTNGVALFYNKEGKICGYVNTVNGELEKWIMCPIALKHDFYSDDEKWSLITVQKDHILLYKLFETSTSIWQYIDLTTFTLKDSYPPLIELRKKSDKSATAPVTKKCETCFFCTKTGGCNNDNFCHNYSGWQPKITATPTADELAKKDLIIDECKRKIADIEDENKKVHLFNEILKRDNKEDAQTIISLTKEKDRLLNESQEWTKECRDMRANRAYMGERKMFSKFDRIAFMSIVGGTLVFCLLMLIGWLLTCWGITINWSPIINGLTDFLFLIGLILLFGGILISLWIMDALLEYENSHRYTMWIDVGLVGSVLWFSLSVLSWCGVIIWFIITELITNGIIIVGG